MMAIEVFGTVLFAAVLVAAAVWDVRSRRIPNALILTGLALALALRVPAGWDPVVAGVTGAGVAFLLTFPLYALGAMGAGDAKLLMVVGAFLGPGGFIPALLLSAIAGGVLAVGYALRGGVMLAALTRTWMLAGRALTFGRTGERLTLDTPGALTIPYGLAIAAGSLTTWFLLRPF